MKKRKLTNKALGDFTMTTRVIPLCFLAIIIGVVSTYLAWVLLKLIGVFTNLFYYGRWGTALVSPADNHLGLWAILVPVGGGLIVGYMARYGSDRIRGHGIPEAIESILMNGSRVQPRLSILKPVSSAVAIGSGGPFGAEGPIIMTGGAVGSMIAQLFHLTSNERKTLMVAGAAAGMAATFAAPMAAILLAVELLLFEWKPRSLIPVALASVTAGAARRYVLGVGPVFPVTLHPIVVGPEILLGCLLAGLLAGVLSITVTQAVYAAEDAFHRLPIHWMWWPAIGGVVVGVGGLIFPPALGVGYSVIGSFLQGDATRVAIAGVLLVKSFIWAASLGSGTSGGVLAPLLMMGSALGGLEAMFLPGAGAGFWPLISMGAMLGGTMRAPLTAILFAAELTHDWNSLLPLVIATMVSYGFSVLILKRSILTEKIARRGYHLSAEYEVDPMELLFVHEVMNPDFSLADDTLANLEQPGAIVAHPDEPLRAVVYRMAENGLTRMPVVERGNVTSLLGILTLEDLLRARTRHLEEDRDRSRVLHIPFLGTRPDPDDRHEDHDSHEDKVTNTRK